MSQEQHIRKESALLKRGIFSTSDFEAFQKSETVTQLKQFMMICIEAVKGKKISDITVLPDIVKNIVDVMAEMNGWIEEIPPLVQQSRFGNKAFRVWFDRLCDNALSLVERIVGPENMSKCCEVSGYLEDSFGNMQRVDYGTGHETTFFVFLCALYKTLIIKREDLPAVILVAFPAYLKVVRHLQTVYWLEPAGSHGVWCLDDYQLLPFLFGSAQLIDNAELPPSCVTDEAIVEKYSSEYMYLEAIKFINITKTGSFEAHSPLLFNLTKMPSWKKINIHLQRYWAREVLGKFPVMQHLRFGTIFPMTWTPEVDPSRQQLKYVNGPHRNDEENPNATYSCCSHMAVGNQKEFTEIQVVPCRCFA
ncbi:hypothetical protein WA588_001084 [Blastocystis sp. NMH]